MTTSSISEVAASPAATLLNIANNHAVAQISLFGGQVLSFCPRKDGRERLYLSKLARLDGSKSIRGGVPICWPWFGSNLSDTALPAHGYVRTRQWRLLETNESEEHTVVLLQAEDSSGTGLNGTAQLQLRIVIGSELEISLLTRNTGAVAFPLSCALHTYFAIADIHRTSVAGISGEYSDKTRNWEHFQTPTHYTFSEETDRIHLQASPAIRINSGKHTTGVKSQGHDSIVVWNPWTACADNFPDMEAEDYSRMLCVETALTQGFKLEPDASHVLTQIID